MHRPMYTSSVEYYDIEAGIQITKTKALREYYVWKTDKVTTCNNSRTKCHTTYYKQCIKKNQLKLEL